MESHKQKGLGHRHPWRVPRTRRIQVPDYCNHVVVDVVHNDIRYLDRSSATLRHRQTHIQDTKRTVIHNEIILQSISTVTSREFQLIFILSLSTE